MKNRRTFKLRNSVSWLVSSALLAVFGLLAPTAAFSVPINVTGVILTPAQRAQAIATLGVTTVLPSDTEVIGFDLSPAIAALKQDPIVFRMFDDGVPPSGPDVSGGPFTGSDVDAVGGQSSAGLTTWATQVTFAQFGPEITPAPNTLGQFHDPNVDGLFGDTPAEGFPANVLGPPDAPVSFSLNINDFKNFTSIGSGGILELAFATGIADRNIVDNFDLFMFEVGAARDNAFFQVDISSTAVPEPISMLLFGTGLVGIGGYVRRKFKQN